jgi:uncharacterized protein YkwD
MTIEWLGAVACGNDGTGWQSAWQAFECEVLELTNQRRAAGATCGGKSMPPVGPLVRQQQLTNSARAHAKDMGDRNYFAHESQDGRSPFDRMQAAGFSGLTMAENISAGQSTPAKVVDGWMKSPGHCANIMNGSLTQLGVGYYLASGSSKYQHYWVQNFGSGASPGSFKQPPPKQTPAPSPAPAPAPPTEQPPVPATQCLTMEQIFAAVPCFYINPSTGRYEGPVEFLRGLDPVAVVNFCKQTLKEGYFDQPLCSPNDVPPPPECLVADQRRVLEYCVGTRRDDPVANWLCWFGTKSPERFRQWVETQSCPVDPSLPPPAAPETPPILIPSPVRFQAPVAPIAQKSSSAPLIVGAAILGGLAWYFL